MKIETTTGHYALTVEGTIRPDKLQELAEDGVKQGVMYRAIATKIKPLTGSAKTLDASKPFDTATGEKVRLLLEKLLGDYINSGLKVSVVSYDGDPNSPEMKEALEVWTAIQAFPAPAFEAKLTQLGLDEDYEDATAIIAVKRALRDARAKLAAQTRADLLAA